MITLDLPNHALGIVCVGAHPDDIEIGCGGALLELNASRSLGGRLRAAAKLRPTQPFRPAVPRNAEARTGLSMGEHAAITAREWEISRAEQDALALESHRRLAGSVARDIDGGRPPYEHLLLPPLDPAVAHRICAALERAVGIGVSIVDLNDYGGSIRAVSPRSLPASTLAVVLRDNPMRQRLTSTPFLLVRPA